MNKYTITAIAAACIITMPSCRKSNAAQETAPVGEEICFADPTIIYENGLYYMTGTSSDNGFEMLVSDNLKSWRPVDNGHGGKILERGNGTFGENSFWAPQIFKDGDKYYLTYSAQGKMCVAEGDSITALYRQTEERPVDDCEEMNIDTYLFRDDDGKYYMYHARYEIQGEAGGNTIQVAQYDMDNMRLVPGTLQLCSKVSEPWELTEDGKKFVNRTLEGPTVIKLDSIYYLFYSANDYQSIDYAVGYATSDNPYGPWQKYKDNPIIHRSNTGENGSGHGDFFTGKDGQAYYVFHVHASDSTIHPRKVRIAPVEMKKDTNTGLYDLSIDKDNIIYPTVEK